MNAFPSPHPEQTHKSHRASWLRAAILGMNDGTVSTASLMLGVFAASAGNPGLVLTTGIAGLAAGALSMAAGEYVAVSSQRDSELSDIAIEEKSLQDNPIEELKELAWIYRMRGLDIGLAMKVAEQLHEHNAVEAHARSELGIDHAAMANPVQAALASAAAFSIGAFIPVAAALVSNEGNGLWLIPSVSLAALIGTGWLAAHVGGGSKPKAALRVGVGGLIAMGATFIIGSFVGSAL